MNVDCLKLTSYTGERDRVAGTFLATALIDLYERHAFQTSVLLRGVEGFGVRHHLHTARLLTLSEDLPIVSVAVDTRERIEAALPEIAALATKGLITLERARMLTGSVSAVQLPEELHEATKLTIYLGRQERIAGGLGYLAVVQALHDTGVAGATVLLGVDGTAHGVRARARFLARNAEVPLMIICVGAGEAIAGVLQQLGRMLQLPLMTLERVRVCKRDGRLLAHPRELPGADHSGLGIWQKLMIYTAAHAQHAGRPLYIQLVRALREAGAIGATSLRGIWGYHGDHQPHGDNPWTIRRETPIVTVVVDTPERIRDWFQIVDTLTAETGLVTSEMVPAFRATGPDIQRGGLRLARLPHTP